jgi:hypothetical protein
MKNTIFVFVLLLVLVQCKRPEAEVVSVTEDTTEVSQATSDEIVEWSLQQYEGELASLPMESESAMTGLNYFNDHVIKDDSVDNDKALKMYLDFQAKLIEGLNNRLMESSDYDEINSLVYDDPAQHTATAFSFEKQITESGLAIAFEEGSVFIDTDPAVIKDHFYNVVTVGTKTYLDQFEIEKNETSSGDAGIIISITEFADRLGKWDTFTQRYPSNVFVEEATKLMKYYRYFLLVGMENTPAFDYESTRVSQEFLSAYEYFLTRYPSTASAPVIKNYLDLLEQAEYQKTQQVAEFVNQYNPYQTNQ